MAKGSNRIDAENTTEGLIITAAGARVLSPARLFDDLRPMPAIEAQQLYDHLRACHERGRILAKPMRAASRRRELVA
jgi:hypothetical protein